MPNYRSLVGGFFSQTPMDKSTGPVTIRMNNPGAINGAKWEMSYPGYVDTVETTPGNRSTIFETPEYGVGAWFQLMTNYRAQGATTVGGIITKYGGGQDYSAYVQTVAKMTGFTPDTVINLNDDQQVLKFGKAMFRYEAGRPLPWSDDQILCGIRGGREFARTRTWPAATAPGPVIPAGPAVPVQPPPTDDLLPLLQKLIMAVAANPPNLPNLPNLQNLPTIPVGNATQQPVLSIIDKLLGGEALTGSKTIIGVLSYVVVTILKSTGVLGVATPAGQILTILSIALSVLGAIAKVDRATQTIGAAVKK
jgi:hypothetical protein